MMRGESLRIASGRRTMIATVACHAVPNFLAHRKTSRQNLSTSGRPFEAVMIRTLNVTLALLIASFVAVATADAQVLSGGNTSTFAVNSSGNVIKWGSGFSIPPGIGFPATPHNAIAVVGGAEHGLALTASGGLLDWGGSMNYSAVNSAGGPFVAIAAGKDTSFALSSGGVVSAWGSTDNNNSVVSNAGGLSNVSAISARENHFMAIQNGAVIGRGLINSGDAATAATAAAVSDAAAISAGDNHAVVLRSGGTVAAWGNTSALSNNIIGQAAIGDITHAVAVAAGGGHSLVLNSSGAVSAFGSSTNFSGIESLSDVVYVTAGTLHSYAIDSAGNFHGFGVNNNAQLNTPGSLTLPTSVQWNGGSGDYLNSHRWEQGIPSTAKSTANFGETATYSVNFGNNASALGLNVTAGNVTFNQNGNSYTVGGPVNVSGAGTQLTVAGSGSQLTSTGTLTNSSTLNVGTSASVSAANISNSSLISVATDGQLTTAGTLTNSNTVNIASGATVSAASIANTGTITNNGTLSGDITTTGTGVLKGSGTVTGTGTTANGGVLAPGNSVGVVTGTNWIFGQDGTFDFEINDATGVAGGPNGWDVLQLTGNLSITATVENPFKVNISSLTGEAAGDAANFNPANNYSWAFVTADTITGFAAEFFSIDATGFTNATGGGSFSISQSGNSLFVNFTSLTAIPEPSSLVLFAVGGVGFAAARRVRRSRLTTKSQSAATGSA